MREIKLDNFTKLKFGGVFNVELINSEESRVEFDCDEEIYSKIDYGVKDNGFYMKLKPGRFFGFSFKNNFVQKINVKLYCSKIDNIRLSGASRLHTSKFMGDEIEIRMSGASAMKGDLEYSKTNIQMSGASSLDLEGRTDNLKIVTSGASNLESRNYEAKKIKLTTSGTSRVSINSKDRVKATLSGVSVIKNYGNNDNTRISSSGMSEFMCA